MADTSVFTRLQRLFSTGVIIRNIGGNQLKVVDTNRLQSSGKIETNDLLDRYNRIWTTPTISGVGNAHIMYRREMFTDFEAMDTDPIITAALDIYADECTTKNYYGDILTITASNEKVSKVLHNLHYDILNIQYNLWSWVRNLCKYGDMYLELQLAEQLGIVNVAPVSVYSISRIEHYSDTEPNAVKFEIDDSLMGTRFQTMTQKRTRENYEIAHFRLLSDTNNLPYGKAMIEGARRVWKQITLLEDAMLIHRILRAPDKRVYYIDVGNIPPAEVDAYMNKVISKMKKVPYVDPETGQYNLKYNMQNLNEDFFMPVRGSASGTKVDTLGGLQYVAMDDIEYLKGKMLAALKVPKAFLNFDESISGKAVLATEDARFARTIERIQSIVVSELTKMSIVHLYMQGFRGNDLVDFDLQLTNPSTVHDRDRVELLQAKVNLSKDMIDNKLFSKEWIYDRIFNLSPDIYLDFDRGMLDDVKKLYRFKQLEEEGNDPVVTGQSFGTAHDIASLYKDKSGEKIPAGYDETKPKVASIVKTPTLGRPDEHSTYESNDHPLGNDPFGRKENKKRYSDGVEKNKKVIFESMKSSLEVAEKKFKLLDESSLK